MSTRLIMRISRWLRLRRICKRLGIKPYPWQKSFALGKTDRLDAPPGRRTGKTMAVMLRLLILTAENCHPVYALLCLECDPDWDWSREKNCSRNDWLAAKKWYIDEYIAMCKKAGINPKYQRYSTFLLFGHE